MVHVPFDFIGTQCGLRTAAKTSYTALALKIGIGYALSGTFENVRNYVRTGGARPPSRLFLNENFQSRFQIGPHQHSIACAGDAKRHCAHAIIVYFGGLFYYVSLSDAYEGADFNWTIACDAQAGKETKILVGEYDNEFLMLEDIAAGNTRWDDTKRSADNLIRKFSHDLGLRFEG